MTSIEEDPIVAVFKVGAESHMRELLSEGLVVMNTAAYFRDVESDAARADWNETASYCTPADGAILSVQIDGQFHEVATIKGPIVHTADELRRANIFCLHALRRSDWNRLLNLDALGFGAAAIMFTDFDEFVRRLKKQAEATGHTVQYGLVDYVDRASYGGEMGLFRKFSNYASQKELRIALLPGAGGRLRLRLGNIDDIALQVRASDRLMLAPRNGKTVLWRSTDQVGVR